MEFEIAGCEQTDEMKKMNSKNNLEMNNKIEICNEGKKAYDIVLRDSFADLLDQMEFLEIEKKKVCIVTESNVAPIYLKEVCELISSKASKTITFSFEAGEKHKQLKTIEALYEELIINHFDRQDLLIALGGGVVGDMTGYAAATIFEALILYRFQQHFYLRLTAVSVERLVLISYSIRTWLGLSISQNLYTSIQQH